MLLLQERDNWWSNDPTTSREVAQAEFYGPEKVTEAIKQNQVQIEQAMGLIKTPGFCT